jgi:Xaa-Pro aminopeptidase
MTTVGIERQSVTLAEYEVLAGIDGVTFGDAGGRIEALRVRKDAAEIEALRRACAVTSAAFEVALDSIRPGVTERELAWALRSAMHERGAEPAFASIVAFGPNSAEPHHEPTDRPLARGELVKCDFGALVDGYHADMTRTVVCGPAADWQRELHEQVRTIQAEARAAARPGTLPRELNAAVESRIGDLGHHVAHGLGHGVGLEIHEAPFLTAQSAAGPLVAGVPVTVEPGIYLPGRGGVRIEDTALVGDDGAEPLTTSPRELIEV